MAMTALLDDAAGQGRGEEQKTDDDESLTDIATHVALLDCQKA
jgi:hypothetical protein